jgi:hypothetical protein
MINKYNDFILESKIISLIIEGQLTCSGDFISKISTFKKKNSVAELLFKLFTKEPYIGGDLKQNYIDITDKYEYVTFLSDKKADDLDLEDDFYKAKGRAEMRVGRLAKAILTDKDVISFFEDSDGKVQKKLTDKDFEDFVNFYKASKVKEDQKFELVDGEKIRGYYDGDNYAFGSRGTLGNSCMRGEDCQDFFDLYTENKNVCSLLVYVDAKDRVLGRALVWKLSKSPCDAKYFMDRIYCSNDSDVIKFINYAEEKGWCYKERQSNDSLNSLIVKYKGSRYIGELRVDLKEANFREYPYLDTLSNLNRKKKFISNISFLGVETLQDTSGETDECYDCQGQGFDTLSCRECDGEGSIDDETCDACEGTGASLCSGCTGQYIEQLEGFEHLSGFSDLENQIEKELDKAKENAPSLKKMFKKK